MALTLFQEAVFWRPATVTVCQTRLGDLEEVRHALDRATAPDPTFTKEPRGVFRLHRTPEDLVDRFMVGAAQGRARRVGHLRFQS